MKTILTLLIATALFSCSPEEQETKTIQNDCNCVKENFTSVSYYDWSSGLAVLRFKKTITGTEQVPCQPEQTNVNIGGTMFYSIKCE